MTNSENAHIQQLLRNSGENVLQRNQTIPLLLIETSNIKYIEPQKWQQYTTQIEQAYKIGKTIDKSNTYGPDMKPAMVIFDSLTDDFKSQLDAEGYVKEMTSVIDKTVEVS